MLSLSSPTPAMGKAAKRKKKASTSSKAKGSAESTIAMVKSNPFEVKVNRQKFNILGRKTKNDVGLPGVSRSKAIKKVRGQQKWGGRWAAVDGEALSLEPPQVR